MGTNSKEYWGKYYEEHKEKILIKNRAWAHSPQATESRHAKLLATKPDKFCKQCGNLLEKISKKRFFCSVVCCQRYHDIQYRIKIREENGERYQRKLAYSKNYYHEHKIVTP